MTRDNHLLARLSQDELIVAPDRQEWFESCLRNVVAHTRADDLLAEQMSADNEDGYWPQPDDWRAVYRPYVVKAGILQIPVFGVLLNRLAFQIGRYATGYTYIQRALQRGMADQEVKGIAFLCDSPGGEVAGNFELVDKIYAARGDKPIRAFAAEHAYSAAYSIASAADTISMTRTAGVGSIGVVTAHVDYSGAMDKEGIKVTFVYAGKHKVDGNPYQKLPDSVKARMQQRIDKLYGIFTATVARNRGIEDQAVRDTEAACYSAEEALEVGLADSIGVFEESLEAFANEVSADTGDENMGNENKTEGMVSQAALIAATEKATLDGKAAGLSEGMKAERTRINAILASDAGKARPKAALSAALNTNMTAEEASAFLGSIAEEKAETVKPETAATAKPDDKAKGANHFEDAMTKSGNPEVGADTTQNDTAKGEDENDLLSAWGMATGRKVGN
jgi:signal peptide peptidase SppA